MLGHLLYDYVEVGGQVCRKWTREEITVLTSYTSSGILLELTGMHPYPESRPIKRIDLNQNLLQLGRELKNGCVCMVEIYPQMCWGENCETVICVHHSSSPPPFFFGIVCKFVGFVDSMTLEASLTCSNKQQIRGFSFSGW